MIQTNKLADLAAACGGDLVGDSDLMISNYSIDSRRLFEVGETLFCALRGDSFDGHNYIEELVERGVKAFVVERGFNNFDPSCGYIVVDDSLRAFQRMAKAKRLSLAGQLTAVVGSNGKSVVKEWILQTAPLSQHISCNPKSYNSQVGVPLSVLKAESDADLYVFEAGISQPNEMISLWEILKPENVIFTTLTDAHSEGFASKEDKLSEKLVMCRGAKRIVYSKDMDLSAAAIEREFSGAELISWGFHPDSTVRVFKFDNGVIEFSFKGKSYSLKIPFSDQSSFENIMSVISFRAATTSPEDFNLSLPLCEEVESVEMRLEVRQGVGGSTIINDSYSSDLSSLSIAIDTLVTYGGESLVVLSDMRQSALSRETLYTKVVGYLRDRGVVNFIGVGEDLSSSKELFAGFNAEFYRDSEELIAALDIDYFRGKTVLLKGGRDFKFEQIAALIERQVHTTILEVNLSSLVTNFSYFRAKIPAKTAIMAMVKADSYGCGAVQISKQLECQGVDFLAVAYTDEGVKLRKAGVKCRIVVLNSEPHGYKSMIKYHLEPEIYSAKSLLEFSKEVKQSLQDSYPIHLKIDSGMHRLGFNRDTLSELILLLRVNSRVSVASIFSHFTSSDMEEHDIYTKAQIALFDELSSEIIDKLSLKGVIRHLSNSAAAEFYPEARFDMVRIGISLYAADRNIPVLMDVASLKSIIAQIHSVKEGEHVGYGRRGYLSRDTRLATVPIGYADGLRRALSCGEWSFEINGKAAPIVGSICMDACMVDVTDIECSEGDEVVIFGENNNIEMMADKLGTIKYEVLTSVAERVKRVYMY